MAFRRFTDEEINKANNVSIVDYINVLSLDTKRAGRTIKVEGYGGLYIDPVKNKWNCFSKGEGGGPIQLVMFLENKTWVESVKTLLGSSYESNLVQTKHKDVKREENKEFVLPKKNSTFNHVIAYLIKTRGIDKEVVYNFIHNKMLYEDEKRNCVLVGYDKEGIPRYAGLRGTNTNVPFKGEINNSDKAYSFNFANKDSNRIYVFESPIELMSYMTIFKKFNNEDFNHNAVSLGGVTDTALDHFLKDNPNIKTIYLNLNNDAPGRKATKYIETKYKNNHNIKVEYPISKDFNQDLIELEKTMFISRSKDVELELEEYELEV